MSIAPAVQADDGKVEPIVGAQDLGITFCGRCDGQPCAAYGQRVEKFRGG